MVRPLLLGALLALPGLAAAEGCGGPVKFAPGADHILLTGTLTGPQGCEFVLEAAKGQSVWAIQSADGPFDVALAWPQAADLTHGDAAVLERSGLMAVRVSLPPDLAGRITTPQAFALLLFVVSPGSMGMRAGYDPVYVTAEASRAGVLPATRSALAP